jgi:hypothetical protein
MAAFFRVLIVGFILAPSLAHAGSPAGLPVPPQGFSNPNNGIPHGEVETISFPTRETGDQAVTVYTPPGYSTDESYPVLYLHHGIGGNAVAWITGEGNADNVMDHLYGEGLATPMIVIMSDGNTKNADGSTRGNNEGFEVHTDVLLNDLIPWHLLSGVGRGLACDCWLVDGRWANRQHRLSEHRRVSLHRGVFVGSQQPAACAEYLGRRGDRAEPAVHVHLVWRSGRPVQRQ